MSDYNPHLKEWIGSSGPSIFNPRASIGDILFFSIGQFENRVEQIMIDDNSQRTYGDLKVASIRVALNLRRMGIKEGDVVSIMCYNNKDVWSVILGCAFIGAPFSCLDLNCEKGKRKVLSISDLHGPQFFLILR